MHDPEQQYSERPNKSQLKREAQALRDLGERLTRLKFQQLQRLPLDEETVDAVKEWHRLAPGEPRRRQLRRIGKLLGAADPEALAAALAQHESGSPEARAVERRAEQWRARLLAEGNTAVAVFIEAYPDADPQRLRQLVRKATRQPESEGSQRAYAELLRQLREEILNRGAN